MSDREDAIRALRLAAGWQDHPEAYGRVDATEQLDAILANDDYRAALLAVLDDGRLARAEAVVEAARISHPPVGLPTVGCRLCAALAAHDTEAGSDE